MSDFATVNTFRIRKWTFLVASVLFYFLPIVISTAVFVPAVKSAGGIKWTFGLAILIMNALPFISGILRHIFSHAPMINTVSFVYTVTYLFLILPPFSPYASILFKIGIAADIGSIASMVFFELYKKNSAMFLSAKTNKKMGVLINK